MAFKLMESAQDHWRITYASDPAHNATVTAVTLRATHTESHASLAWFEVNGAVLGTQTITREGTVRTVSPSGRTIETGRDGRLISESGANDGRSTGSVLYVLLHIVRRN